MLDLRDPLLTVLGPCSLGHRAAEAVLLSMLASDHSVMTHKRLITLAQGVTALVNPCIKCIILILNCIVYASQKSGGLCVRGTFAAEVCKLACGLASVNCQVSKCENIPGVYRLEA